jgi:CRISPR system Cascade subunit CasE
MHGAVLSCFHAGQEGGRVLWRLDPHLSEQWLYVVSPAPPDLTSLIEQAGWPQTDGGDVRSYGPLLDRLAMGQRWQFRLTANPTQASRRGGPIAVGRPPRMLERSKRFGHVTVKHQEEWLLTRCEAWGFTIPYDEEQDALDLVVSERKVESFRRGDNRVTIAKASYEGHLVVGDPEALRRTLVTGAGPAKAYGCGLLTLAPPRRA